MFNGIFFCNYKFVKFQCKSKFDLKIIELKNLQLFNDKIFRRRFQFDLTLLFSIIFQPQIFLSIFLCQTWQIFRARSNLFDNVCVAFWVSRFDDFDFGSDIRNKFCYFRNGSFHVIPKSFKDNRLWPNGVHNFADFSLQFLVDHTL
jgi:hypothetical protein